MAGALITEIILKSFAAGESVESEGFFLLFPFPAIFLTPTHLQPFSLSLTLSLSLFLLWMKIISYSLSTALGIR